MVVAGSACGKRGAPLPPLPRVPAGVETFSAVRRGDAVELTVLVPASNAGGDQPGDIGQIEVYAVTAATAPALEPGRIPPGAVLVASSPVRRPRPPAPDPPPGTPPLPLPPGVDQGTSVAFTETLTPALLRPAAADAPLTDGAEPAAGPVVFERPELRLKRHYMAVAVSRRGRRGAWSAVRSVPVAPPSSAPSAPALTYDADRYHLTWTPPPDAWLAPPPAADLLESRPLGPVRPPTRYHVYAADANGTPSSAAPLTAEPVAAPAFDVGPVAFDVERCFVVRGVDTFDGVAVEGPASAPGCVTARDTFPPPAPAALEAVGGAGVISLIWEGVEVPDLAGYLVLRGEAGSEPATLLTPAPITARSFEDREVTAGSRYVYVVVAVDSATPANRSAPSNRAEETARQ
jgi:hypothetical protein